MKIQHLTRYAGPDGNYPPGFVREAADAAAIALINGGYAICLDEPKIIQAEAEPQQSEPLPEAKPAPKPKPKTTKKAGP